MTVTETRQRTATIVVCDDDEPTLKILCDHLTADNFEALAAPTAADAMQLCSMNKPDMLLLDLGLPDRTGLDLLRDIRTADRAVNRLDPDLGVIIVSGRGSEADRIRGLNQGADDYIAKPFSYGELLARINAVLRRRRQSSQPTFQVRDLEVNDLERSVKVAGEQVRLTVKEYALLRVLVAEPTRVFSKEELLAEVWGNRSMNHSRTLEAHTSRLRGKLGGAYITSCWGVGYRLIDP